MLGMGVLVRVVREAGSVYQVPAVLQTTVLVVTGGNYMGTRHSSKNKGDRIKKKYRKYMEIKLAVKHMYNQTPCCLSAENVTAVTGATRTWMGMGLSGKALWHGAEVALEYQDQVTSSRKDTKPQGC